MSIIEALGSADPDHRRDAADLLIRAYRPAVVTLLTWRWRLEPADAEDVVQDFFATALEKQWFERFDPAKGRFRTFLRMMADRFAASWQQSAGRLKRGGGSVTVSLDHVPGGVGADDSESERRFRDEWIKSVFTLARTALRDEATARTREVHLALFESYDLADDVDRPTYAELGAQHGLSGTEVINHLAWARRRFRSHVLDVVRQLAGSEREYREDVRDLLGIDPP